MNIIFAFLQLTFCGVNLVLYFQNRGSSPLWALSLHLVGAAVCGAGGLVSLALIAGGMP